MLSFAKRALSGTRLEPAARSVLAYATHRLLGDPSREWLLRFARDEAALDALVSTLVTPVAVCVDIGAHRGMVLERVLALAPLGSHYAIEPLPELAAHLRAAYPQATVFDCAVGATTGRVEFFAVKNRPGWSGLRRQPYPAGAIVRPITVDLRRLDDLIPGRVDFIKIDVEGAELGALRGAERLLRRWQPALLFEHATLHAQAFGTTAGEMYAFLREFGYAIHTLDGDAPLSLPAFEAVVRRAFTSGYDRHAHTNFLARVPR